jgi:hypothetical protein
VVYAHGTGGSYRSATLDAQPLSLAAELAKGELGEGAKAPAATFGYDGPLHGPRRGASTRPPDELVFNYLNPRAARDTPLQGVADLFAIARAMEGFSVAGVKLDGTKVALYGHSQGGNAAAVASGFEPVYKTVVLSGTGGGLTQGILEKKKPVAVAGLLPVAFNEKAGVDGGHPVLSLMQMFFDRADPVNFGRRIVADPPKDVPPHHLLHIYGSMDNYAPDNTQALFARAASVTEVIHPVVTGKALEALTPVMAPVKANKQIGMSSVTAVQAQFNPEPAYDGHFVATRHAEARKMLLYTIGTFFRDGVPTVK